jgi:3',5'-cyclic AMP phosphodiesterase CpdA
MKIAHLSDLHLLALDDLDPRRLLNKRFTGWVNIKLNRGSKHKLAVAQAAARALRDHNVDHVVVTGDVTNLALESEFELVLRYLRDDVGLDPANISLVPGNHDMYTRGAYRSRRFEHYFEAYLKSDLPGAGSVPNAGSFPYVKLRGEAAIIGLSSAVPRPPLMASGQLGSEQRAALHGILAHREVKSRTPVILQHHPLHNPRTRAKTLLEGLWDADAERSILAELSSGLLLHGHLHRRVHRVLPTRHGEVHAIGSTSASLLHDDVDRMSGFNIYQLDESGLTDASAFRYVPDRDAYVPTEIPQPNDAL